MAEEQDIEIQSVDEQETENQPVDEQEVESQSVGEQPEKLTGTIPSETKSLEEVIQREAVEEQDAASQFSISRTLGGVIIARAVQKQMGLLLLICVFLLIYISNRYVCQKKMVEIDRMESKLVEARYKAIVCTSILTEKSRESNIMTLLSAYGDSTLQIPQEPPYLIKVPEEEN